MKDILGNTLNLGDEIIYFTCRGTQCRGRIIRIIHRFRRTWSRATSTWVEEPYTTVTVQREGRWMSVLRNLNRTVRVPVAA